MRKLLVIKNCAQECPHIVKVRTPGAGYAEDYHCGKAPIDPKTMKLRMIAGYIEWPSELPVDGEFPRWCPLFEAEEGMYE